MSAICVCKTELTRVKERACVARQRERERKKSERERERESKRGAKGKWERVVKEKMSPRQHNSERAVAAGVLC